VDSFVHQMKTTTLLSLVHRLHYVILLLLCLYYIELGLTTATGEIYPNSSV